MEILVNENNDYILITVKGDVEMMTIKDFKEKLFNIVKNTNKNVEVDLSKVDYIDSSGVGVLISLLKMQKEKNKKLKIEKVSSQVMNVLQLGSLTEIFNLK